MNPVRLLIVLVAAVSAIGLAVVMQRAMGGKPSAAPAAVAAPTGKPMTQVLVAKHDLAIGARLTGDDVTWQAWPSDAVNTAFITNGAAPAKPEGGKATVVAAANAASDMIGGVDPAKAVEGAIVRDPILTGEPITPRKIVRGGEGGYLSVVLSPGKRAVSVPITSETAVGGFILPGDRVDVLATYETPNGMREAGADKLVAVTVLENVRVLALDQSTAAEKDAKSIVAATATLEVAPADAEALTHAKAGGPVTLALRAYTDLGGHSGVVLKQGRPKTQDEHTVRVNRGGMTSNVSVSP